MNVNVAHSREGTTISVAELHALVEAWGLRVGFSEADAATVATVIVDADLHGAHSHGVRLLAGLMPEVEAGTIDPRARPELVVDHGATAVIDGRHAFGPIVSTEALVQVLQRSEVHGTAAIAIRNSSHWGRPAYYGRVAAERGIVLIGVSNSAAAMPLWGATRKSVGNNPIVIGVPRRDAEPLVLDISMQTAAWGRVRLYRDSGQRLPSDWGFARDGTPTDDPDELLASGRIRPMGDHKGSGLAVMFEMLTAGLAGGLHSLDLTARMEAGDHQRKSQLFIGLDPAKFSDLESIVSVADSYAAEIRDLEPAPGTPGPRLPGEGSAAARRENLRLGIRVTPALATAIARLLPVDRSIIGVV